MTDQPDTSIDFCLGKLPWYKYPCIYVYQGNTITAVIRLLPVRGQEQLAERLIARLQDILAENWHGREN